jgi:hypothetical protein
LFQSLYEATADERREVLQENEMRSWRRTA